MHQITVSALSGFIYVRIIDQFVFNLSEKIFTGLSYYDLPALNTSPADKAELERPISKEILQKELSEKRFVEPDWPREPGTLARIFGSGTFKSYVKNTGMLVFMWICAEIYTVYLNSSHENQSLKLSALWPAVLLFYSLYHLIAASSVLISKYKSVPQVMLISATFGFLASWISIELLNGENMFDFNFETLISSLQSIVESIKSSTESGTYPWLGISKNRIILSVCCSSAIITSALVYPCINLAKCYLLAIEECKHSILNSSKLRIALSMPFVLIYSMLTSSWMSTEDRRVFVKQNVWSYFVLVFAFISLYLWCLPTMIQSFLNSANSRRKQLLSLPLKQKLSLLSYQKMIQLISQSSCVIALQLLIPIVIVASLQMILLSNIWTFGSSLKTMEITSQLELNKPGGIQLLIKELSGPGIVVPLVKFFSWWSLLNILVLAGGAITYGRVLRLDYIL